MICEECGREFRSASGLASHLRAKHPDRDDGSVLSAVRSELRGVEGSEGLKASAIRLARLLDETHAARDAAALARELRQTLDAVVGEADEEPTSDGVDDLAARRAARRAAATGGVGP